jgi:hypothetical protein
MFNTLALLLCGVSLAASVLFLLSPLTGAPGFGLFSAGEKHKLLMVVCALAATGVLFLFAARARKAVAKVFLFALAVLPVMICQAPALPDFVIRKKAPEALFKRNADKVAPDSFLVAYNSLIHTACWIYKRDDICLLHKPGELDYGLRADDAKNRLIPIKSFNKMTEDPALKGKIVLLMEYQDKRDMLPKGSFEDKEGEMFFIKY